jgi:hypothetical protein
VAILPVTGKPRPASRVGAASPSFSRLLGWTNII